MRTVQALLFSAALLPLACRPAGDAGHPGGLQVPPGASAGAGGPPAAGAASGPALPAGGPQAAEPPPAPELEARVQAMRKEIAARPGSVELMVALGNVLLANGRAQDAIGWYGQAIEATDPGWRRYLALPAGARAAPPSAAARSRCSRSEARGYLRLAREAEALERAGARADAAFCWRAALETSLEAHVKRANAFLLAGNAAEALAEHEATLALDPRNGDALFYRGAILADQAADAAGFRRAEEALGRYLAVAPHGEHARAARDGMARMEARTRDAGAPAPAAASAPFLAAQGSAPAPAPGDVSQGVVDALAGMDTSDPAFWKAADAQVAHAEDLLARGDAEQARQYLKGLMPVMMMKGKDAPPMLYERVLTGMGWAYVELGNRAMGPRLLQMALDKDPGNAQARAGLDALARGAPLPRFRPGAGGS